MSGGWTHPEGQRFALLFAELDGSPQEQRLEVTQACIETLFDKVLNPPMLDVEDPTLRDVEAAERSIIDMVTKEADRLRRLIGPHDLEPPAHPH